MAAANTYYVDASASSVGQDGSAGHPFTTLQAAVTAATSGDTILVAAGQYSGNVVIDKSLNIQGAGSGSVVLTGVEGSGGLGTFHLNPNVNNVTIDGFTIVGIDSSNPLIEVAAIYLQGAHTGIKITNNEVVAAGDLAIDSEYASAVSDVLIDHNRFSGATFDPSVPLEAFTTYSASQFSIDNVPRPVVYFGNTNKTNIQFTNNIVETQSGSIDENGHFRGNVSVVLDGSNNTATDNVFAGLNNVAGASDLDNAPALRMRGTGHTAADNSFDTSITGGIDSSSQASVVSSFTPGSSGNDYFFAGPSTNETFDGGDGSDTIDMTGAGTSGAFVDLDSGLAFSSDTGLDHLGSIENVKGSVGDDALYGNGEQNTFIATDGQDVIDGRGWFDTIDASNSTEDTEVDFGAGTLSSNDFDIQFQNVEAVRTGSGDDNIHVAHGFDWSVDGGAGFDTVKIDHPDQGVDVAWNANDQVFEVGYGWDNNVDDEDVTEDDGHVRVTGVETLELSSGQHIWLVTNGAELTAALAAAATDDIIQLAGEEFTGTFTVGVKVTIRGTNPWRDGNDPARVQESVIDGGLFITAAGVTVTGIKITGAVDKALTGTDLDTGIVIAADDVTIQNSVFDGASTTDSRPFATYGIQNFQAHNNVVTAWDEGVYITASATGGIHHNEFTGNGNGVVTESVDVFIDHNTFTDSVGAHIAVAGYADPLDVGSFISDNDFTDPATKPQPITIYPNSSDVGTVVFGSDVAETVVGDYRGSNPFEVHAGGGDDVVYGTTGNDTIEGGDGNDEIDGGDGEDIALFGGDPDAANDIVWNDDDGVWEVKSGTETDTLVNVEIVDDVNGNNAKTLLVGGGGYATLQEAINAASAGDTIMLSSGTLADIGTVIINKQLTILGANHGLEGDDAGRGAESVLSTNAALSITANNVVIDGIKIVGGTAANDTGIYIAANGVTIAHSVIEGDGSSYAGIQTPYGGNVTGLVINGNLFTDWDSASYFNPTTQVSIYDNHFDGLQSLNIGNLATGSSVHDNEFTDTGIYAPIAYDVMDNNENVGQFIGTGNTFDNGPARDVSIYVYGTPGGGDAGITVTGTSLNDRFVNATYNANSNDKFDGGAGNDYLEGAGGNDTLIGGDGNDTIDGGAGTDTVVFEHAINEYVIERNQSTGDYSVTRNGTVDTVKAGIEFFQFGTQTIDVQGANGNAVVNQFAPVFDPAGAEAVSIAENVANVVVYDANATDADSAATFGAIVYSLEGADAGAFSINSANGQVTLTTAADRETKASYALTIRASQGVTSSTKALTVNVTDVNDNPVVFTSGATATVQENASTGTVVYDANATDRDTGTMVYSLAGTDAAAFNIDAATGEVRLKTAADFETKASYVFSVVGTQGGSSASQAVTLTVTNVDEGIVSGVDAKTVQVEAGSTKAALGTLSSNAALTFDVVAINNGGGHVYLGDTELVAGVTGLTQAQINSLTFSSVNDGSIQFLAHQGGNTDELNVILDVTAGVGKTYTGTSGADTIDGADGNDTILGKAGADHLLGGAGKDTVDGGAGADWIDGGAGKDSLTGGKGNDTIFGGAGKDHIDGGKGDDELHGGAGKDTLVGGSGADKFVFDTALSSGNADVIEDFVHNTDTLVLDSDFFAALGATVGSKEFRANLTGNAQDKNDKLIYETDTGKLYYDADGNKSGDKVLVATFDPHVTLSHTDFEIV